VLFAFNAKQKLSANHGDAKNAIKRECHILKKNSSFLLREILQAAVCTELRVENYLEIYSYSATEIQSTLSSLASKITCQVYKDVQQFRATLEKLRKQYLNKRPELFESCAQVTRLIYHLLLVKRTKGGFDIRNNLEVIPDQFSGEDAVKFP
jgi:hypothetical protein